MNSQWFSHIDSSANPPTCTVNCSFFQSSRALHVSGEISLNLVKALTLRPFFCAEVLHSPSISKAQNGGYPHGYFWWEIHGKWKPPGFTITNMEVSIAMGVFINEGLGGTPMDWKPPNRNRLNQEKLGFIQWLLNLGLKMMRIPQSVATLAIGFLGTPIFRQTQVLVDGCATLWNPKKVMV